MGEGMGIGVGGLWGVSGGVLKSVGEGWGWGEVDGWMGGEERTHHEACVVWRKMGREVGW